MGYNLLHSKSTELCVEDSEVEETQALQALESLDELVYVKTDCIVVSAAKAI